MNMRSSRPILLIAPLLAACPFPDKVCIGDCAAPGPTSESGHTTGATFTGSDVDSDSYSTSDGAPVDVCAVADDLAPASCGDGVLQPGDFCFPGGGGPGFPVGIVSTVPGRFDGVGGVDLLVSHTDRTVSAELDGPAPYLDMSSVTWPKVFPADALVLTGAGDLDGDGRIDAVGRRVGGDGDAVVALLTDGAGQLAAEDAWSLGALLFGPEVLDWDLDGDLDLLVITAPADNLENTIILRNDGTGAFTQNPLFGFDPEPTEFAAGALGPGPAPDDLAWADGAAIEVLISSPGDLGLHIALGQGEFVHRLRIAELDGDGRGDIAALIEDTVGGGTSLAVFLQSVDAAGDPAFVRTDYPVRCGATTFALGDIDHDGALDVVTGGEEPTSVTIRRGDGDGGFPQALGVAFGPADEIHIADFDGDGDTDVVLADHAAGGLTFLPNEP